MSEYGDTGYIDDLIEDARKDKLDAEKRLDDLRRIKSLLPMCKNGYNEASQINVYCHDQAGHRGAHDYGIDV